MRYKICLSQSGANRLRAAIASISLCGLLSQAHAQTAQPVDSKSASAAAATAASPAPLQIEKRAMALLKRNQQAMFALKTYAVECRATQIREQPRPGFSHFEYELSTLVAEKPNKMRYEQWYMRLPDKPIESWAKPKQWLPNTVFACDGTTRIQEFGNEYRTSKLVAPLYLGTLMEPWRGFFRAEDSPLGEVERARKGNSLHIVRVEGRENVGGVTCDKVFVEYDTAYAGSAMLYRITWYFGPDGLTRRCINGVDIPNGNGGFVNDSVLVNLRVNQPADAGLFAYTPPKGVKKMVEEPPAPLLAAGAAAPNISGLDRNNKPVKLADLRGKVVVVDFWASWCLPCNAAMPHNQAVIRKLQAEGVPVVMLAVDNADTRDAFDGWIKRRSKEFPALQFVFVPASEAISVPYHAAVIPTQYVLDRAGVIRASFAGFDKPNDDLEKAVRAALTVTGEKKAGAEANH